MANAAYDLFAKGYAAYLRADDGAAPTVHGLATRHLLAALGEVRGRRLLDLGCGEGRIARLVQGAGGQVTGVDVSAELLAMARAQGAGVDYAQGDAQDLRLFGDESFDAVYSNLALMDIPDLGAVYRAVHRVLRPRGRFAFTLVHPCFSPPHADFLQDGAGRFVARLIFGYTDEGFWRSRTPGSVRHAVGAHHRMLSTYVNGLIGAGFTLERLAEPTFPAGPYAHAAGECHSKMPPVLVVQAIRHTDAGVG